MKTNTLIILFVFLNTCCFGQKKTTIKIEEIWIPLKVYENDKLVKNDEKSIKSIYKFNISSNKDSISYFNISPISTDKEPSIIYVLKTNNQTKEQNLFIKENEITDSLNIKFSDETNTITINKKDTYFLNTKYYNDLKNTIQNNLNILDLVDLLDDLLGDYSYQLEFLQRISSNKKYKNKDFKIIKAKISTQRSQSNLEDIWNVTYGYNKENILSSVIKKSKENDLNFEKKLLSKKGMEYKYRIYRNVESRFEDNNVITFNVLNNTYNALYSHFQFGLVKEEISQLKRILYKKE